MGLSKSKYDVEKNHTGVKEKVTGVASKPSARKDDSWTLQMKNEVTKNMEEAKQRNDVNGEKATTSKNVENSENEKYTRDVVEELEELSVLAQTLESETPTFEKVVRKHEDEAIAVEGTKTEKNILKSSEENNEDGQKETQEIKEESGTIPPSDPEIEKGKQEMLVEIAKNENPSVAEDKSPIQKTKDEEIEEEMMKAIVTQQKHEDNENISPQSRNDSEIPKTGESASCTIEENQKGEEDQPKHQRKVSFNPEVTSNIEISENKLQSEIKSDSNSEEAAKKKVEAEIPNQTESVAEARKSIEIIANDARAENKTHINKEEENSEENQLVRKMEEQEIIKPDEVKEEANQENKEIEKEIYNKVIQVDIEVHQTKDTKIEENNSQEVLQEEAQSGNVTKVKLTEENVVKETVHQEEEITAGEDQKQNRISEIQSHTEEKAIRAIEKPSIIDKPIVITSGDKEGVPEEDNLASTETLSKKLQETQSNEISEGQSAGENVISKEIHPILQKVQEIEEQTKVLREQIIQFSGTDNDVEYRILNDTLIKNMLKLDDLSVEDDEEIRAERKRVITFVQECLKTLERNVVKMKDDSDSN